MKFWKKKPEYVVEKLTKDMAGTRLDEGDVVLLPGGGEIIYGYITEVIDQNAIEIEGLSVDFDRRIYWAMDVLKATAIQITPEIRRKYDEKQT